MIIGTNAQVVDAFLRNKDAKNHRCTLFTDETHPFLYSYNSDYIVASYCKSLGKYLVNENRNFATRNNHVKELIRGLERIKADYILVPKPRSRVESIEYIKTSLELLFKKKNIGREELSIIAKRVKKMYCTLSQISLDTDKKIYNTLKDLDDYEMEKWFTAKIVARKISTA